MYYLQRNELRKFITPINKHDADAKMSNLGNSTNAVKLIRKKLGKTGIKLFKKTCFGHFLKMKPIKFCGGFVHSLLLRQVECNDSKVLEFNFRGLGVRFDRKAFATVTGLKCCRFPSYLETRDLQTSLWEKYFGSIGTISLKDLMARFEECQFDKADVEDNVKACMLYLLEAVLLGGEKRRPVTYDNFKIIENKALCNKYPWGTLSYNMTIASLRSAVNRSNPSKTYTLYGFPIAFQISLYVVFNI